MLRTRVKICGITRMVDAETAITAGVDALGLVFYPRSPRYIEPLQAAKMVRSLGPFVTWVGLFMNASSKEIARVMETVALDMLQFHGTESPEACEQFGMRYIKASGIQGLEDPVAFAEHYSNACGILIDSHAGGEAGGTGQTFDWEVLPDRFPKPLILAGGLHPSNVAAAIRQRQPYAIDLSSGVEAAPGIKDPELIQALMQEVKRVDCET